MDASALVAPAWKILSDIVGYYGNKSSNFFETHIEPLQKRIDTIHADYMKGFRETRKHLKDNSTPSDDVIEFLEARRSDYEADRIMAKNVASELESSSKFSSSIKQAMISAYCDAVTRYLSIGPQMAGLSWYSDLLHIVKRNKARGQEGRLVWFTTSISGHPIGELTSQCDRALQMLPKEYDKICAAYAKIRAAFK